MMFGWRRRSEGFEWREYVRTTILVRRADRQKRIDEARLAALAKVKDTRDKGLEAGRSRVRAAGSRIVSVARAGANAAFEAAKMASAAALRMMRSFGAMLRGHLAAVPVFTMPPSLTRALTVIAMYASDVPRRWRLAKPYVLPAAGIAGAVFVFGTALSPQQTTLASLVPGSTPVGAAVQQEGEAASTDAVVTGHAVAITGDVLRIEGRLLKLAGIDAPVAGQPCLKSNGRKWSCAASARTALERLVRGEKVACEIQSNAGAGATASPPAAHCRTRRGDIAQVLVENGHAFGSEAFGNPYAADAERAKARRVGVWQGQVDHPDAWRTKVWDEAKRAAPEGCPIKGLVKSEGRIYAMPWAEGYAERTVRAVKGERWFCSEDEAQAAGFRLSSRL